MTNIDALPISADLLAELAAGNGNAITSEPLFPAWNRLQSGEGSAVDFAHTWLYALELDSDGGWQTERQRIFVLLCLVDWFEKMRLRSFVTLQTALRAFTTRTGRPLNVPGTRCELIGRTAEACFKDGRREPAEPVNRLLLSTSVDLISAALADCRQKLDPHYAKRWRGMRGTCRLLLAAAYDAKAAHRFTLVVEAAVDLNAAFQLGNRGESAAAYLCDALLQLAVHDDNAAAWQRFDEAIATLVTGERDTRAIKTLLGRAAMLRHRPGLQTEENLFQAVNHFTSALTFVPMMAFDDEFVRLNRGECLLRITQEHTASADSEGGLLDLAIEDLSYVTESNAAKFGSKGSLRFALSLRSRRAANAGDYGAARADLRRLSRYARDGAPENDDRAAYLRLQLLMIDLREALDREDFAIVAKVLPVVVSHSQCDAFMAAIVGRACRQLFASGVAPGNPRLLIDTITMLDALETSIADPESRRRHIALSASLSYALATKWDAAAYRTALAKYERATDASSAPAPAELLSSHGDCALQYAKNLLRRSTDIARATDYLEEAAEALTAAARKAEDDPSALSTSFSLVVTLSKAGEAWLRLAKLSRAPEDCMKSIEAFTGAYNLGNATSQLLGLWGDAWYRHYLSTRTRESLLQALHLKRRARATGATSRENLSLSSRLSFLLWEQDGRLEDLTTSLSLVADAHHHFPDWPWPPFQLFEIHDGVDPHVLGAAYAGFPEGSTARPLVGERTNTDDLLHLGTKLVLKNEEFTQLALGGRQKAYVLDDPHQLLGSSYVFKPTTAMDAARDRDTVLGFGEFLRSRGFLDVRLPTPLAIVPVDGKDQVIYVMRRAYGLQLARLAIRARTAGLLPPIREYRVAIRLLAAFHAWRSITTPARSVNVRSFVEAELRRTAGFVPDLCDETRAMFDTLGPLPRLAKKDAHAENWLVDDFGNVVMIDFESTRLQPILFEVAQLLDDCPLLPVSTDGWNARINLCDEYLTTLEDLSGAPVFLRTPDIRSLYFLHAALRVRFGLRHTKQRLKAPTSSSALRGASVRAAHYLELRDYIAATAPHGIANLVADLGRSDGRTAEGIERPGCD
jgi:tetratricopeptide (TPR) repeat protein